MLWSEDGETSLNLQAELTKKLQPAFDKFISMLTTTSNQESSTTTSILGNAGTDMTGVNQKPQQKCPKRPGTPPFFIKHALVSNYSFIETTFEKTINQKYA